jgi:hypothetical protein
MFLGIGPSWFHASALPYIDDVEGSSATFVSDTAEENSTEISIDIGHGRLY